MCHKTLLSAYMNVIVLGFNDTLTLVGHFVSAHREKNRRDSRGDEREGQGKKGTGMKGKKHKRYKYSPLPLPATVSQYQLDAMVM